MYICQNQTKDMIITDKKVGKWDLLDFLEPQIEDENIERVTVIAESGNKCYYVELEYTPERFKVDSNHDYFNGHGDHITQISEPILKLIKITYIRYFPGSTTEMELKSTSYRHKEIIKMLQYNLPFFVSK